MPGARRLLGAEGGEGGGAVVEDPRQVGERLDVVDHRRLQVEALGGREERRLEARHAAVALEALDEGGLLADDVGAGAPVQDDVDGEVGAEDVLADVAGGVGVVEGLGDALLGQRHLAADVEERLGGADGVAGDEHALDELVRVLLHEEPVLVGAGLGLVAVHHEVARPHAGRAEAPLGAGGEAGAAAAEEAGRLHLVADRGGRLGQRRLQALVAAGGEVAVEGVPVVEVEAGGDDRRRRRRRSSRAPRWAAGCRSHTGSSATARDGVAGAAVGGQLLAGAGEDAVLGHLVGAPAVAEVVDQGVGVVRGDLVEVAVVHLEARRLGAGRDALDVLEGEGAVGGGAAGT